MTRAERPPRRTPTAKGHRRSRRPAPSSMTRAERRAAISHRRSVVALIASGVAAAVILVAWFPAAALIDQRRTLTSAAATLSQLQQQDKALSAESKNLSTASELERIARQQFQLVPEGDQAYQVLPPAGTTGGATDPYSGDPGLSAPVSPSAALDLPPGSLPTTSATGAASKAKSTVAAASSPDLLTRLLHTLEFWR